MFKYTKVILNCLGSNNYYGCYKEYNIFKSPIEYVGSNRSKLFAIGRYKLTNITSVTLELFYV